MQCLPETLRGDTVHNAYKKIQVCPKCFSIYELITKEMEILKKVGVDRYFHSWAEMEEAIREKLIKYYKFGNTTGDNSPKRSEIPDTDRSSIKHRPLSIDHSESGSPRHSILKKSNPHYMLPTSGAPSRRPSYCTGQDCESKTETNLRASDSITRNATKRQMTAGTSKFQLPNERIVFRETAAQVRDTKLHMGLPAGQARTSDLQLQPTALADEDFLPSGRFGGTVNLFAQKIKRPPRRKNQSGFNQAFQAAAEDPLQKQSKSHDEIDMKVIKQEDEVEELDKFVAGRAIQYGKHAAFMLGLLRLIKKAQYPSEK
ncbi:MAG: hypothetical protein P4M11_14540 [Candidatus Pacebacteria bacterium]|nr:hypothetical protein [Candidatus Paceibacterota bacterium]